MAQLYDHSLMLSIAIQNARFSLIVSFSHSNPSTKVPKRLIKTEPHPSSRAPSPGQPRSDHDSLCRRVLLARSETKLSYPLQHFTEHIPVHHHLSKMEYQPPGMAHQTPACLDESGLDTRQRPTLYRFWQSKSSHEVAHIVGQYEYPQPHLVGHELVTG